MVSLNVTLYLNLLCYDFFSWLSNVQCCDIVFDDIILKCPLSVFEEIAQVIKTFKLEVQLAKLNVSKNVCMCSNTETLDVTTIMNKYLYCSSFG